MEWIGVLGFALALVSLVWQFIQWRLTGSVVRVTTRWAIITMTDGSIGPEVISISASNRGRTQASVSGWGLALPDGASIISIPPEPWQGPNVPHRLDVGHEATWFITKAEVRKTLQEQGMSGVELRGFVSLGTGKRLVSKRGSVVVE